MNASGSRSKIIEVIKKMKDGFHDSLDEIEVQTIKFHPKSCYSAYILKASRFKESVDKVETNDPGLCGYSKQDSRVKRSSNRISSPPPSTSTALLPSPPAIDPLLQQFIICNVVSKNKVPEMFRFHERNRAKTILATMKFNEDEVPQRCILYEKPSDIFATDLYVHKDLSGNI